MVEAVVVFCFYLGAVFVAFVVPVVFRCVSVFVFEVLLSVDVVAVCGY